MPLHPNLPHTRINPYLILQFALSEYFKIQKQTPSPLPLFSWTLDATPTLKLQRYCELLHEEKSFPQKERDRLKKESENPKKLGAALLALLKSVEPDENLLFFLLRYKESVDAHFGKGTTAKLVNSRRDTLKKRYKERHFSSLLAQIDQHLAQL